MGDGQRSRMMSPDEFVDEEKKLRDFAFYHGFLARDDLNSVLNNEGDYLLRLSETDPIPGQPSSEIKRDIVMSVNIAKDRIKHVIVYHKANKYFCDPSQQFESLNELFVYYTKNYGMLKKNRFILKNPIALQRWEHLHRDIKLGKLLGEGAFGEVRQGELEKRWNGKKVEVAVKLLKGCAGQMVGKDKIKEMMHEARIMRNYKHKNVVRIYGVAVHQQPIYIILELVKGGSLFSFLKENAGKVNLKEKLNMCYGASLGVEFLHKNQCIHRDLAARNCLYTNDKIIKISDFGLAKTGTLYHIKSKTKVPIKWLAPETIAKLIFSTKTDVYSFGVILYEIFTDAGEPWGEMKNAEVKKDLKEGKFLKMPPETPDTLRDFVADRIFVSEDARTTMAEVTKFLFAKFLTSEADKSLYTAATTKSSQKKSDNSAKSTYSGMPDGIGTKEGMGSLKKKKKGFHNRKKAGKD